MRELLVVARFLAARGRVRESLLERVSERDEFFLNECREAVEGAEVRIEEQLRQRTNLRRAVPAVRAVHEDGRAAGPDLVVNELRARFDLAKNGACE